MNCIINLWQKKKKTKQNNNYTHIVYYRNYIKKKLKNDLIISYKNIFVYVCIQIKCLLNSYMVP